MLHVFDSAVLLLVGNPPVQSEHKQWMVGIFDSCWQVCLGVAVAALRSYSPHAGQSLPSVSELVVAGHAHASRGLPIAGFHSPRSFCVRSLLQESQRLFLKHTSVV